MPNKRNFIVNEKLNYLIDKHQPEKAVQRHAHEVGWWMPVYYRKRPTH